MELPNELLYKIAKHSDDYIKTLNKFNITPTAYDYKYVYNNCLNELKGLPKETLYKNGDTFMQYIKDTNEWHYIKKLDITIYKGVYGWLDPHKPPMERVRMSIEEYNRLLANGGLEEYIEEYIEKEQ